ncbi:PAS domain S-box protein [Bacteroidota bacterium]
MENSKIKILAIDDNQDNLTSLRAILVDMMPGVRVITASSGRKGIALAMMENPDVILLDILMPGLDGFEVCRQLKEDTSLRAISIVFLTAQKTNRESQIMALEAGGEAFLSKPIDEMHLVATIAAMVKIKESHETKKKEQDRLSNLIQERTIKLQQETVQRSRAENELEKANQKLRKSQSALLNLLEDLKKQNRARIEGEEKYRLLFTQMTEGFALHEIICNDKGVPVDYRFLEVNSAFEKITGLMADQLIGKSALEVMPGLEERWIKTYGKVALTGKPVDFTQYSMELDKTYEVHAFSTQVNRFATVFSDVSDQVRTEQSLRESENKFRRITEQVADLIFMTDRNGLLVYISPASRTLFGYEPHEMLTENFTNFLDKAEIRRAVAAFKLSMKTGKITDMILKMERKDGKLFDGELRATIYKDHGRVQGTIGLIHDITERKKLQEEIASSREQLRKLNEHVIEAREEERMNISREIHDELGQALSALKLDLGWIMKNTSENIVLQERVEKMIQLTTSTISDVQRISSSLRPGILDDLGLSAACEWYCEEFEKRSGLNLETVIDTIETSPSAESTAIFRILQEGLTNILRHAQASKVNIILKSTNKNIHLSISDDGVGIPEERLDSRDSLGMLGMRERVRQFAGTFAVTSSEGKGTLLKIKIPI